MDSLVFLFFSFQLKINTFGTKQFYSAPSRPKLSILCPQGPRLSSTDFPSLSMMPGNNSQYSSSFSGRNKSYLHLLKVPKYGRFTDPCAFLSAGPSKYYE